MHSFLEKLEHGTVAIRSRNLNYPKHMHAEVEILFMKEGSVRLETEETRTRLHEGNAVLFPPFSVHGYCKEGPNEASIAIFPLSVSPGISERMPDVPIVMKDCDRNVEKIMLLLEECRWDDAEPIYVGGLLTALAALVTQEKGKETHTSVAHMAKALMIAREGRIGLDETASLLGYSRSHVSREFSKTFGISASEFLTRLRLENARIRLKTSEDRIEDIAIASGFNTIRSFDRAFLKIYGTSPGKYRRSKASSKQ